ncbi:50S ribosomal protein L24 [Candidatus Daviesbacteria bacterium]|nr:50S ribosomal protein L24 [Candidatus Daviesbacteria bacterium]
MQKILKGDNVMVQLGKDRGKTGTIERVLAKEGKVFVGGANLVKRHVKRQGQIEGGIIDIIKPMNISNVALICPKCKKPTRIGFVVEGQTKKRICKKCKAVI